MGVPQTNNHSNKSQANGPEKTMKGTMFSVGFVAFVIVAMWIAVFWIYMERV
jgi:hypothetical protein